VISDESSISEIDDGRLIDVNENDENANSQTFLSRELLENSIQINDEQFAKRCDPL
jgi:hypothetical protein